MLVPALADPGIGWLFERAWARLYGTVTLEVFGHVHPGLIENGAIFLASILDIARDLGLEGEWPRLEAQLRADLQPPPR